MVAKVVSQSDVFSAARDLVSAGERPSILAIHKRLGRGSNTTIAKYRNQFLESDEMRDLQVASLPAVADVPGEFEEEGSHFVKKIWQMAKSVSDAQLEAEREALSSKHEIMQQEVTDAVDFSDSVAGERDEYKERSEAQAIDIEKLKSEATELKHALEMSGQKIEVLAADLKTVSSDALEVKKELSVSIRDASSLKQEVAGFISQLSETKSAHLAEVSRLLDQSEAEKGRMMRQADKSLIDLKAAHDEAVVHLVDHHNKFQGQVQADVADLRKQRDQFKEEINDLRHQCAELQDVNIKLKAASLEKTKPIKPN